MFKAEHTEGEGRYEGIFTEGAASLKYPEHMSGRERGPQPHNVPGQGPSTTLQAFLEPL